MKIKLASLSDNLLQNDLLLLTDVVARTQVTNEVVTWDLGHQIFSSSDFFEWCGTAVIARIPLDIPSEFSFYDYIS